MAIEHTQAVNVSKKGQSPKPDEKKKKSKRERQKIQKLQSDRTQFKIMTSCGVLRPPKAVEIVRVN